MLKPLPKLSERFLIERFSTATTTDSFDSFSPRSVSVRNLGSDFAEPDLSIETSMLLGTCLMDSDKKRDHYSSSKHLDSRDAAVKHRCQADGSLYMVASSGLQDSISQQGIDNFDINTTYTGLNGSSLKDAFLMSDFLNMSSTLDFPQKDMSMPITFFNNSKVSQDGNISRTSSLGSFELPSFQACSKEIPLQGWSPKQVVRSVRNASIDRQAHFCTQSSPIEKDSSAVTSKCMPTIIQPSFSRRKVQYRKTRLCPWYFSGKCLMGTNCNYAHDDSELRGRPDLTRTRICPKMESCKDPSCRFAHYSTELRATGAFYRTKICKFWQQGSCSAGIHCRHAHGYEQLRKPNEKHQNNLFLSWPDKSYTSTPHRTSIDLTLDGQSTNCDGLDTSTEQSTGSRTMSIVSQDSPHEQNSQPELALLNALAQFLLEHPTEMTQEHKNESLLSNRLDLYTADTYQDFFQDTSSLEFFDTSFLKKIES